MKFKYITPLILSITLLASSILLYINKEPEIKNYNITLVDIGFDTVISFSSDCTQSQFDQYVTIIKERYTYYNNLFDQYNAYDGIQNVYTINHEGYKNPITVDQDLLECIELSFQINDLNSKFDITQGNLLSLWHTYRSKGLQLNKEGKSGQLPSKEEIQASLSHYGQDKVIIKGNTIQLLDKDISLDLGGIAKGYATQKVKEELIKNGCSQGFINAGGNIVLIGQKKNGQPWKVGIQNPDTGSSIVALNLTESKSIVTSGDYQRYYTVNDKRYSHIIDPSTGYPANYVRSITIVCDDSSIADALSTTLFCLSYEEGYSLLQQLKKKMTIDAIWIVNQKDGADIQKDGYSIFISDGLKNSVIY